MENSRILHLSRILSYELYSDDVNTLEKEPNVPSTVAMLIQNHGNGNAFNFYLNSVASKLTSYGTTAKSSFKVIDTNLYSSKFSYQPVAQQPKLTSSVGDVGPSTSSIVTWTIIPTTSASFTSFSTSPTHIDILGYQGSTCMS